MPVLWPFTTMIREDEKRITHRGRRNPKVRAANKRASSARRRNRS